MKFIQPTRRITLIARKVVSVVLMIAMVGMVFGPFPFEIPEGQAQEGPASGGTILRPVYHEDLAGLWTFNGGSVSNYQVADDSGNNNDGTASTTFSTRILSSVTRQGAESTACTSSGTSCTLSNFTLSTGSGNNRIVVVGVSTENDGDVTAVTFNGTNMTEINEADSSGFFGGVTASLWYILDTNLPSSAGDYDVVVTTTSENHRHVGAAEFTGVAQQAPEASNTGTSGASGSISTSVTTASDGAVVIDVVAASASDGDTPGAGQEELYDTAVSGSNGAGSYQIKEFAGSTSMSWSGPTALRAQVVAAFEPASIRNELTALRPGKIGQALEFDGTDDYVDVGNVGSGIKTISFWMKADDVTSRKIMNIDGTDQIEINASSNVVATSFPAATVYVDGSSGSATVSTSTWHHVVITDTTGVNASAVDIGRVGSGYFDGTLDEVYFYERTLNQNEVTKLTNFGKTRIGVQMAEDLAGYWQFQEGGGTKSYDHSGHVRHGDAYGAIGWDFANAVYDSKSLDAGSETSDFNALAFKPDGTKVFVIGLGGSDDVFQYSLSTPWDISTASYDFRSFRPSEASVPGGIDFSTDGVKMFISDGSGSVIYQYSLSTPWDVATASYDSVSLDVINQTSGPKGLAFKPDGTKMYVVGNDDTIYRYSLSPRWSLASASYDSNSKSVNSEDATPRAVEFKPDGTKMYMVGANDTVYQYSLSTAWSVSSASYDSVSVSVRSETGTNNSRGVRFSADGTKMYVASDNNDRIWQYDMSTQGLGGASFSDGKSGQGSAITFDGSKTYIDVGSVSGTVHTISFWMQADDTTSRAILNIDGTDKVELNGSGEVVATSFPSATVYVDGSSSSATVSTSTWHHVTVVDQTGVSPADFEIGRSGLSYFDGKLDEVRLYTRVFTQADITRLTKIQRTRVNSSQNDAVASGLQGMWSFNGADVYSAQVTDVSGSGNNGFSGRNVSSATYNFTNFPITQEQNPADVDFKSDGTKMYVLAGIDGVVYQYSLSSPWNISSASYDSVSTSTGNEGSSEHSISFKSDGTKMYMVSSGNDTVFQYSLSTAWDLSTASYDSVSFGTGGQDGDPRDSHFKSDGTKMYLLGDGSDAVYQYSLSPAWDLSSISYDSVSFSVSGQTAGPRGFTFSSDGGYMYVHATSAIFQYSLSTAWDLSTASYDSVSFSTSDEDGTLGNIAFNNDDTLMYIAGASTDSLYQYNIGSFSPTIGKVGQALEFDGTDDYVSVGNVGSGIQTISFWMKADDVTSRKIMDIDGTDQIEIDASSNVVATSFPNATVYIDGSSSSATVTAGGWHHVLITDSTGVNASSVDIGRVSTSYFDGTLDEVRMYNRVLSAGEIRALYHLGGGR